MPGSMGRYRYTGDDGTNYRVRLATVVATSVGFTAAQTGDLTLPKRFKMRHAICSWFSAGGAGQAVGKFTRSVPIPTVGHAIWAGTDDVISLPDYNSVPGAGQTSPNVMRDFTVTGLAGERRTLT
jgi:hypothetical protein